MNGEIRTHALSGHAVLQTGALNHLATFTYFLEEPNSVHILTMVGVALIRGRRVSGLFFFTTNPCSKREVGYCTVYTGIVTNKGFTVQALS